MIAIPCRKKRPVTRKIDFAHQLPTNLPFTARNDNERKIINLMSDGRLRKTSEIAEQAGIPNAAHHLMNLVEAGQMVRVKMGLYQKPGSEIEDQTVLLSPAERRIYGILAQPSTAVEIHRILKVSRQRIDVLLSKLAESGFINRAEISGETTPYLYFRSDRDPEEVITDHQSHLREETAVLLSTIEPDGWTSIEKAREICDISQYLWTASMRKLQKLELAETAGLDYPVAIRLTAKGLEHPQYDRDASKADIYEPTGFQGTMIKTLLILDAFGEAKSSDITLLTGHTVATVGSNMSYLISLLRGKGYLISEDRDRNQRMYHSLTETGRMQVENLKRVVNIGDAETLRARLACLRAPTDAPHPLKGTFNRRTADILTAMQKRKTPMSTREIIEAIPNAPRKRDSIHYNLQRLVKVGKIRLLKKGASGNPAIWELS